MVDRRVAEKATNKKMLRDNTELGQAFGVARGASSCADQHALTRLDCFAGKSSCRMLPIVCASFLPTGGRRQSSLRPLAAISQPDQEFDPLCCGKQGKRDIVGATGRE
jgi:hypothetical protein